MLALYPSKANIDAWGKLGNPGWSHDILAPYFQKFSTIHPPSTSAKTIIRSLGKHHDESMFAAGDGPVQLSFSEGYTAELNGAWMETFSNLNLDMTADPRSGTAMGAFQNAATIDPATHTRSWAASAYLGPKVRNRSNLVVLTETLVKRIILEENEDVLATGKALRLSSAHYSIIPLVAEVPTCSRPLIFLFLGSLLPILLLLLLLEGQNSVTRWQYGSSGTIANIPTSGVVVQRKDGSEKTIHARLEVILAAGALQSPQILELSGIGNRKLLERHAIPVVIENPNVSFITNLQTGLYESKLLTCFDTRWERTCRTIPWYAKTLRFRMEFLRQIQLCATRV